MPYTLYILSPLGDVLHRQTVHDPDELHVLCEELFDTWDPRRNQYVLRSDPVLTVGS